jgi:hypothetical protein
LGVAAAVTSLPIPGAASCQPTWMKESPSLSLTILPMVAEIRTFALTENY